MVKSRDSFRIGDTLIFLSKINSTNDYAKEYAKTHENASGTVILTYNQEDGRGQYGRKWFAEPNKNIAMSFILKPQGMKLKDIWKMNIAVCVAIAQTVEECIEKQVEIKWPNDILINGQKISGMLVETILKEDEIEQVIVGIGLNVEQSNFKEKFGNATSLNNQGFTHLDKKQVFDILLKQLSITVNKQSIEEMQDLIEIYNKKLWKSDLPSHIYIRSKSYTCLDYFLNNQGFMTVKTQSGTEEVEVFDFKLDRN